MDKVLIIAEAGVNHNGNLETAKELVDKAVMAKADIVKFQTARLDSLVTASAQMAEYQKQSVSRTETQKEMLKKLLLSFGEFMELSQYCQKNNIVFLSTPFDIESIHFLNEMVPFWKIPSGEITDYPYLVEIGRTKKPVVLSTGMCRIEEIEDAVSVLKKSGTSKITLLQCNTQYPTPYEDANLRGMDTLKNHFGCEVGYSDHTPGIEVPIAAVAMGAAVIEKHFTLDRGMEGPDHKASLEPDELKAMVEAIRNIEKAMGNGDKVVSESERNNIAIARKSIVARCRIKEGDIFSDDNITTKRPGTGINPMNWESVTGQRAKRNFEEDELIEL